MNEERLVKLNKEYKKLQKQIIVYIVFIALLTVIVEIIFIKSIGHKCYIDVLESYMTTIANKTEEDF